MVMGMVMVIVVAIVIVMTIVTVIVKVRVSKRLKRSHPTPPGPTPPLPLPLLQFGYCVMRISQNFSWISQKLKNLTKNCAKLFLQKVFAKKFLRCLCPPAMKVDSGLAKVWKLRSNFRDLRGGDFATKSDYNAKNSFDLARQSCLRWHDNVVFSPDFFAFIFISRPRGSGRRGLFCSSRTLKRLREISKRLLKPARIHRLQRLLHTV